ncbi:penicillin-binding protein 1C [Magnetospirillum aberrantis]|uniref:peptidoglycan glycosyltransferase n=1 Tax=Magnetospirillum aberrantis SpK TaxID=908842 RepID=A0A7C9UWC9_9PROT|nr:penicillin-binding protein 1C [Magnetospirillum aberrantis]NFV82207.1 penicillin-binding protein 1C [Magnetospirillum aberrantis SpK]
MIPLPRILNSWKRPAARRALGIGLAVTVLAVAADRLSPPDLGRFEDRSTVVLDSDGRLLRAFPSPQDTWRLPTRPDQVDPLYLAMLRTVEDRRFGWHPGIDPLAALRAMGQWARHGRVVSGASTLSMQAARLLQPKARTWGAKVEESLRAMQLQARLGTDGVLGIYLTLAPFGGALEGVTAASLAWFGKDPVHLGPAEAALLVALPQSPERLRPDRHPAAARAARDRVLDRAAAAGIIARDVAEAAKTADIPAFQRPLPMQAPHLAERLATAAPRGAVIRTRIDGGLQRRLEALARAEAERLEPGADVAMVIVANADRRLLASVGAAHWLSRQTDLTLATRSPGSTLKPFIYAMAFDDLSLHPGTLMTDMPQRFGHWRPDNFDHDFHGTLTAREALQRSLNIPAVQVLERVGPIRFVALMQQSGIRLAFPPGGEEPGLPLALGGVGIRLLDLATLYAALADGGRVLPPSILADTPPPEARRLVGEAAARAVLTVLEDSPAPDGFAQGSAVARARRIAFKTGTSFGFRDAWTVGTSADYTVAVWVGRPDGAPRPGAMGRGTAAPVLFRAFDLLPPDHAPRPRPTQPDHALFHRAPPPALARLEAESRTDGGAAAPLRILFPPDGAMVESLDDGIGLDAAGGHPPYRWIADGRPLGGETRFWRPETEGFSRLVVTDSDGRRAAVTIRVSVPGD